jgi:hypothetical protein
MQLAQGVGAPAVFGKGVSVQESKVERLVPSMHLMCKHQAPQKGSMLGAPIGKERRDCGSESRWVVADISQPVFFETSGHYGG